MRFLNNEEESQPEPEKIVVHKLVKMSLDCIGCELYVEMEGGPVDDEWAKFMCPQCGIINKIRWGFDL